MWRTKKNIDRIKPQKDKGRQYKSSYVHAMDDCDADKWSRIEVDDEVVTKIGLVAAELSYYYLKPEEDMDEGLMLLEDNNSSITMASHGLKEGLMDLFVVQKDRNEAADEEEDGQLLVKWKGGKSGKTQHEMFKLIDEDIDDLTPEIEILKGPQRSCLDSINNEGVDIEEDDGSMGLGKQKAAQRKLFGLIDEDDGSSPAYIDMVENEPRYGVDSIIGAGCSDIPDGAEKEDVGVVKCEGEATDGNLANHFEGEGTQVGVVAQVVDIAESHDAAQAADVEKGSDDEQRKTDGSNNKPVKVGRKRAKVKSKSRRKKKNNLDDDTLDQMLEKVRRKKKGVEEEEEDSEVEPNGNAEFYDSDYAQEIDEESRIMKERMKDLSKILGEEETTKPTTTGDDDGTCDDEAEMDFDELPSDDAYNGAASDEDVKLPTFRRYNRQTDYDSPNWEIGLRFASKAEFKELCKHREVKHGKQIRFKKNDGRRCQAWCRGNGARVCLWKVIITYRKGKDEWAVTTLVMKHDCGGKNNNHGCANSDYLAVMFKEKMRICPQTTVGQLREKINLKLSTEVSWCLAVNTRAKALKLIEASSSSLGSIKIHFGGELYAKPYPLYWGGAFRVFNNVDLQTVSFWNLHEMAQRIGMLNIVTFYSLSEEKGVEKIVGDGIFFPMCQDALNRDRLITLYALDYQDEWFFARNDDFLDSDPDLKWDSDYACNCEQYGGWKEYNSDEDSDSQCSSQCSCTDFP
ncbi:OLC1v1034726C1 [Oldenlandia corymbosa var. corymbosa]|uniref:OLC1v1034726C1 n=1 Tax=Oldenlandia corymbosa var. corymbosa TaxID=529605 RepID=A0AAV1CS02_OLDCO|nr:OLC1v1034726C1 [Oldenlandia corymbosa var. corymbosa]